jgi:hypothetical protein
MKKGIKPKATRPTSKARTIGLDEQIQEAKKLFSLLTNPELLKQGR